MIPGKDSNVLAGFDIVESSGSSEAIQRSENSLTDMPHMNSSTDMNSNTIEFIDVPIEPKNASKASLQTDLLQHQIEYTKRDIYHRELAILEKERSLSLLPEERQRLLANSKTRFENRKSI